MRFRSLSSFGKRQEYSVIAELLKRGYDVYMTLVDDQGIDCVVRLNDKKYYDIQIKARSINCKPYDAGRFAAMNIPNPRPNYIFVFYSEHTDTMWVIPSEHITGTGKNKIKIGIRNLKGDNKGKYHVMLTGLRKGKPYPLEKYKQYQNAFEKHLK